MKTKMLVSLVLVFMALTPAGAVQAQGNTNPGVLPPYSSYGGNTYGAWSARWWQYVELQPASSNPLVDLTGANCGVGQSGPVFFLVGTNGGGTVTRNQCTVPAGKALFFPLVNAFDVHVPGDGLDTAQKVWDDLEVTNGFSISSLEASVDGVSVGNLSPASTPYRACAGPVARCSAPSFSLTFPADNFFGIPAGTYEPAVADGVYLLLAPLAPGHHTIKFGGTSFAFGSWNNEDITYHLVVSSQ